jgi:hypothetical protein
MGSMLNSSAVDREFESRSGQTKDTKIGISCFSYDFVYILFGVRPIIRQSDSPTVLVARGPTSIGAPC